MVENFVVCVGKQAKDIPVIKSIATRSSKFFQAAMDHDWKEAREKRVMLPDTKVDDFEGYLHWLYTGDITFSGSEGSTAIVRFYILGDYLDDMRFRHAVLDCFCARFSARKQVPDASVVQIAWDNTPSNSLLRLMILEIWSSTKIENSVKWLLNPDPEVTPYPKEFIKAHFERFVSSNALEDTRSTVRTREEVLADFKLVMSARMELENAMTGANW
jgi:hypothetical protein